MRRCGPAGWPAGASDARVRHLTKKGRGGAGADCTAGAIGAAAIGIGIFIAGHGGVVGHPGSGRAGWLVFPVSLLIGAVVGAFAGGVMSWLLSLRPARAR